MRRIVVFGRGKYFAEKSIAIQREYQIAAFLDNAVCGESFDEDYSCPVYNPKEMKRILEYNILVTSSYFIDMWRQLKQLGVRDENIFFANTLEPLQLGVETFAFGNGERLFSAGSQLVYTLTTGESFCFGSEDEFKDILRKVSIDRFPAIHLVSSLPVVPVSRVFGSERGKALDRYYIETFLEEHSSDIKGCCMEIGTDMYTKRYGAGKVTKSCILHVEGYGNAIKGNFETGEGLHADMVDCLICTQTLQYIYDVQTAIKNIYYILKPQGVALITVPGIKPLCLFDEDNWGEKWSFTEKSLANLCQELGDKIRFSVCSYGNVKVAVAYLYGLCCEELSESDYIYKDRQYPFLIAARIQKK